MADQVLVVGGGPAGLAAALGARRAGFGVTVLDRRLPPIDKACGEGLMPDGLAALEALGLAGESVSGRPFVGIRYVDGESVAEARFPSSPGLGIRRTTLHGALVKAAEECGVELLWGVKATGLENTGAGWRVESEGRAWSPRWVVGADGLHSRVRRWAGLERPRPMTASTRFGVRRHFRLEPWSHHVEVHWADGVEAYITPVTENEVEIAFLWSGAKRGFDAHLQAFPALAARIAGAPITSRDRGAGALEQRPRAVTRENLALVGDAGGYLDAITGEGLSLAFHQALALTEAFEQGDLGSYRAAHRRLRRVPDLITRLLLLAERRPWLRRRAIRGLARDPALFARLLAVHAREVSPKELGVRGLAGLTGGLVRALAGAGGPSESPKTVVEIPRS